MGRRNLDLHGLADIDGGRINQVFCRLRDLAAKDCKDRPQINKKPRRLHMIVDFWPGEPAEEGSLLIENLQMAVNMKIVTPPGSCKEVTLGVDSHDQPYFSEYATENPDQRTIDEMMGEDEDDGGQLGYGDQNDNPAT